MEYELQITHWKKSTDGEKRWCTAEHATFTLTKKSLEALSVVAKNARKFPFVSVNGESTDGTQITFELRWQTEEQ